MSIDLLEQWLKSLAPGATVTIRVTVPGGQRPASTRVCSVEGCGRRHVAKGYCVMHYNRLLKRGTTEDPVQRSRESKPCGVESCERPAVCRGYCDRHYQRFRRLGSAEAPDRRLKAPRKCSVDGCSEIVKAHGLCNTHYMAAKRGSHPVEMSGQQASPGQRCFCGASMYLSGLCETHYHQALHRRQRESWKDQRENPIPASTRESFDETAAMNEDPREGLHIKTVRRGDLPDQSGSLMLPE